MRVRVGSFRFNVSLSFTAAAEQMDRVWFFFGVQLRVKLFSLCLYGLFFCNRVQFFQNKSTGKGQPSVAQAAEVQAQFSILCL